MSGSSPYVFVEADKVDVRRFCGYPAYGFGPSGFQGWRFFQAYGLLEYRLNNMDPTEGAVVQTYLGNLRTLEAAIPAASANLDTDKAAVWTHNKNEVRDRTRLFDDWRKRLCAFLGVPPGPSFSTSTGLSLVV
jgi:hypothetical protein